MPDRDLAVAIMKAVDDGFDEQVAFTAELVKCPSVRGAEASAQDLMARELRARGFAVDRWTIDVDEIRRLPGFSPVTVSYENALTVAGALRAGEVGGRSLIFNGHVDVVPVGPLEMWHSPPFAPRIEDGWMYGRGAGDMKAGLVSAVFAVEALRRIGLRPAADLYIHSVIEEECTGNGALSCLQRGYRADAVMIPEPMRCRLMRAELGVLWFRVGVRGEPAHAALATTGSNAIMASFRLMQALRELEDDWNARSKDDPHFRAVDHPINLNVGKIAGGDWASSVPAWCTFDVRVSFLPGMTIEQAKAEVERCLREAAREDPFLANFPPEIVYNGFFAEPWVLEGGGPAEDLLGRTHRQVFGRALEDMVLTGATDARFYGLYGGMPTLVYGAEAENVHGFNERVNLESVRKTTQTLALFVAEWCGVRRA